MSKTINVANLINLKRGESLGLPLIKYPKREHRVFNKEELRAISDHLGRKELPTQGKYSIIVDH